MFNILNRDIEVGEVKRVSSHFGPQKGQKISIIEISKSKLISHHSIPHSYIPHDFSLEWFSNLIVCGFLKLDFL
jgi:hypothetical protein